MDSGQTWTLPLQTHPQRGPIFHQGDEWYEQQGIGGSYATAHPPIHEQYFLVCEQPVPRYSGEELRSLQQHYLFLNSSSRILELLNEEPSLFTLLSEATEPLCRAFGDKTIVHVRIQSADDGTLLRVVVQLPADFPDAEHALQSFDENWWLRNCHRSDGTLVFDYEQQDAV